MKSLLIIALMLGTLLAACKKAPEATPATPQSAAPTGEAQPAPEAAPAPGTEVNAGQSQ